MRATLFAVLLGVCTAGCFSHTSAQKKAAADGPRLSVMTYNLNFGLAGDAATVKAAGSRDADVIFFQESNARWEKALRAELGQSHPYGYFRDDPVAGGLGVMSKLPIEWMEYLPAASWFPAQLVVLSTPMGRVQVLNVHLRPPVSDSGSVVSGYFTTRNVRANEIETFAAKLDPVMPTLIVGDFNESESGQAIGWLKAHRGMSSALPQFQPKAKTWHWTAYGVTLHNRYDHLIYDARLRPVHAEVIKAGRSDHRPVYGVFTLAEKSE